MVRTHRTRLSNSLKAKRQAAMRDLRTQANLAILLVFVLAISASAATPPKKEAAISLGPVDYLGSLRSPSDVKNPPSGFKRFLKKVVGLEDDQRRMVLPHGIAVDSSGRVLVADTKGAVVHVFDVKHHR